MRVPVKDMSGNYIHPTTPRKARLLIRDKKAVVDSNNPFTIRLLFSASECGLKNSKSLNKLNSGLLPEKDLTMCGNEEINVLAKTLNEFYVFALQSIRHILNSTDVDKVTWYTKNSAYVSGENDPESFVDMLHSTGRMLFSKNHRVKGNFVLIGKQGFDILKKIRSPRVSFKEDTCVIDSFMDVKYIPSMDDTRFIVSVYEPIDFDDNDAYKKYYSIYENMDAIVVGEIVDGECSEKSESEEAIKQQNKSDNNKYEKENTLCDEKISLEVEQEEQKHHSTRRTTHLIFGYYGCGKTTYIRQLINDKIQNCLGVCVLTNAYSSKLYFNKEDKNLHIFTIADILTFIPDKEKNPTNIAKAIVDCFVANVGRFNIDTIVVDGMDIVIPSINSDYSEDEYFRELSKCCKNNKFNLLYTKGISKIENDSSYHKIPTVFERFSDIITVIK